MARAQHRILQHNLVHRPTFRTPLWYYMLKQAELAATGRFGNADRGFLGPAGSRLVAKVVAGGVYYNEAATNFRRQPAWTSSLTGSAVVHFAGIANAAGLPDVRG